MRPDKLPQIKNSINAHIPNHPKVRSFLEFQFWNVKICEIGFKHGPPEFLLGSHLIPFILEGHKFKDHPRMAQNENIKNIYKPHSYQDVHQSHTIVLKLPLSGNY